MNNWLRLVQSCPLPFPGVPDTTAEGEGLVLDSGKGDDEGEFETDGLPDGLVEPEGLKEFETDGEGGFVTQGGWGLLPTQ